MEYKGHDLNNVMSIKPYDVLQSIIDNELKVILYGAGIQCRTFISLLREAGIKEQQLILLDSNKF